MTALPHIVIEEFRRILGDSGARVMLLVSALFYAFFYPMPYLNEVVRGAPIAVVDLDNSALSRQIARNIDAAEQVEIVLRPVSFADAVTAFFDREVSGVVVIPADTGRKVARGEKASVAIYADGSYFMMYRQLSGGIGGAVAATSAGIEIARHVAAGKSFVQASAAQGPIRNVTVPLANPAGGYGTYVVPAAFVLILQQSLLMGVALLGATFIARGERLLPPGVFLPAGVLARASAYLAIYLGWVVFYFVIMARFYRFKQAANPLDLILFATPFLLSVIFLGMAISALFRQREAPLLALVATSSPAAFLSGFSWPREAMPEWLVAAAHILPSTSGIDGMLRLNQLGATLYHVRFDWLVLWGLTLVYFLLACLAHRRAASLSSRMETSPAGWEAA